MKVSFDPDISLPEVDSHLQAEAAVLVAAAPRVRTQKVTLAGRPAWLKRAIQQPSQVILALRALLFASRVGAARWLTLPEGGAAQLDRELRRIAWLSEQGVRVPSVLAHGDGWMMLEDCGVSIRDLMPRFGLHERLPLLQGVLEDMESLHALGVWHGGGQIKNTTLLNEQRTLIDFEDGFGDDADLLDLQARDLFLFLTSCSEWVPASTLEEFVQHYAARESGMMVAVRAHQISAFLNGQWTRILPGGDVRCSRAAARALQRVS